MWSKSEMKHLKHPKHLKHLKHFLWMLGLLFCKHFKELSGKINDGVHKRQDQKGMLLFLGWWSCGHCGMEMNKKSGGGDVRAKALAWDDEWDKA